MRGLPFLPKMGFSAFLIFRKNVTNILVVDSYPKFTFVETVIIMPASIFKSAYLVMKQLFD
jgi:hypothetical protein